MPAKNKKTKHPLRQKRLPLICLGVAICLVAATVFLFVRSMDLGEQKPASRSDFVALQQAVGRVRDSVGGIATVWHDESSCTDIKPRLFGERERYYCTVKYSRTITIDSTDTGVASMYTHQLTADMNDDDNVEDIAQSGQLSYSYDDRGFHIGHGTESYDFVLEGAPTNTRCSANNTLTLQGDGLVLAQDITCRIDAGGLFLDTVQEA